MKNFCLLLLLFSFYSGFSQSLPINFEGDISNADFVDFDGGTAIVTTNPDPSGINTSPSVGRIVRDGGAIYAGSKILLSDNLDFSELTKITMKVYTTAPVGTTVKFKLEGSGPPVEVDAFTTVSGTWESLEWVFTGTENNLNEIVFMFDFGNVGDGTASSTFYFDDVDQIAGPAAPVPATLPIDFESGVVDTDFLNFGGASASVISNPQMDDDNPSPTVCQIVRDGGDFWAGSKIFIEETIDLSTEWHISMKVYTTAPIGTRIKLELENASGRTNLDYLTTSTGTWETASWNFYGQANDYNRIQVMFDFGNIGDGSTTSTFLFDDVMQVTGPAIPDPIATTLPIDFEGSIETTDFINESGGIAEVIPNPYVDENNPSATVARFVRSGGAPWAKSKLALTDFIMDMSTVGSFSMKVYTDAPIGTTLKFKIESNVDNFADERDAVTTVSGEWATYTWDFTNQDNPIYNVLTFMLGYATPNDASANATFLFDDIQQISKTASDGSKQSLNLDDISIYPNPVNDFLNITSSDASLKKITLFDIVGNQISVVQPNSKETTINVSQLPRGMYIAKISTDEGTGSIEFIKE
ncbi:MAG: T9SS type A sorting domain-containing protein [Saprospiraceae bacterium]|nr:T9SS type A sorting domain-containing protein [Saprospiraceae bacterium]